MTEVLTGIGLSASAGLNAYIPLLIIGLLARYTDLIQLPAPWQWLERKDVLIVLGILLVIEIIADKVPIVDHINDIIQTVIRPTSGGLAFGAAASSTTSVAVPLLSNNPDTPVSGSNHSWIAIGAGMVISFVVHVAKALSRPVVNATTAGLGAPVASTIEDILSITMSFVAIIFAPLFIIVLVAMIWFLIAMRRRRKRAKAQQQAMAPAPS